MQRLTTGRPELPEATLPHENVPNSIFRSLASLWIVFVGMTAQGILLLSFEAAPMPVAVGLGVLWTFWVLPALSFFTLGISGLPESWPRLIQTTIELFLEKYGFFTGVLYLIANVWQILVFLPFDCPKELEAILPRWLKLFLFREPAKPYPYRPQQLEAALVKNEYWIFINGIATTKDMAEANRQQLCDVFRRPIWLFHNPTDGLLIDLLECIADKLGWFDYFWETEPRRKLKEDLFGAIQGDTYSRVVLFCHSQGTIITARVLEDLSLRADQDANFRQRMKQKLEVYAVANAAHRMSAANVARLESLSFGRDSVPWLGQLFPYPNFWQDAHGRPIAFTDGVQLMTEPLRWGHLFTTHYMHAFLRGAFPESRLHRYAQRQS